METRPMPLPAWGLSRATPATRVARHGLYAIVILISLLAAFAYKLRTDFVFACPASGYGSDRYLAYCQTSGYGDYDHGAFWFGLEPAARSAAANADTLFLGNSRMQFAFSTEATSKWFAATGSRFYMLGFSFGENAQFEAPLLDQLKPKASVYVINVDRFFDDDYVTAPVQAIRHHADEARAGFEEKKRWQTFHEGICSSVPALCGHQVAFYRSRDTGAWLLEGSEDFKAAFVANAPAEPVDPARLRQRIARAAEMVGKLPVDRQCVLLTVAPWEATNSADARAIADALHLELVTPDVPGLRTLDGDHLDRTSAQRWSAAFFDAAGPRIQQCLAAARGTAAR